MGNQVGVTDGPVGEEDGNNNSATETTKLPVYNITSQVCHAVLDKFYKIKSGYIEGKRNKVAFFTACHGLPFSDIKKVCLLLRDAFKRTNTPCPDDCDLEENTLQITNIAENQVYVYFKYDKDVMVKMKVREEVLKNFDAIYKKVAPGLLEEFPAGTSASTSVNKNDESTTNKNTSEFEALIKAFVIPAVTRPIRRKKTLARTPRTSVKKVKK